VTGPAPAAAPTADHPDFGETVTAVLGDDLPGILATLSGLQSRFSASADQASAAA
jgi:hypothetical protein